MDADTLNEFRDRIADLEIRLTHQEAALEELVRSGLEQQRSIERLTEALQRMRETLDDVASPAPGAAGDEPPPHY